MTTETREKILDAAERRVRRAGFSEMSFRDLASDVGIKSASVHYHFPTKPDLGEALVDRYAQKFKLRLEEITLDTLEAALEGFIGLYSDALVLQESICLCAVMGAEAIGLPHNINQRTKAFFDMNKEWLEVVFNKFGVEKAGDTASMIVAALEGGMIVASASNDRAVFERIAQATTRYVLGS